MMRTLLTTKLMMVITAMALSLQAAKAQSTFNIFAEDTTLGAGVILQGNSDLFVWENTFAGTTPDNFFGEGTLGFEPANDGILGWAGLGITMRTDEDADWSGFVDGSMSLAMKVDVTSPLPTLGFANVAGNAWKYQIEDGEYGFALDGEWHEMSIPLSAFAPVDAGPALSISTLSNIEQALTIEGLSTFCIDEVFLTSDPATGVFNRQEEEALAAFPNPAENQVTLIGLPASADVTIYDVTGNVVLSTVTPMEGTIDVSGLKEGTYFVRSLANDQIFVSQFVKK